MTAKNVMWQQLFLKLINCINMYFKYISIYKIHYIFMHMYNVYTRPSLKAATLNVTIKFINIVD